MLQVLWALDQHQSLLYPWARAHLRVQHLPGELRVCSAETGGKIAAIIPDPLPVHFPAGPAAVEAALCCDAVQANILSVAPTSAARAGRFESVGTHRRMAGCCRCTRFRWRRSGRWGTCCAMVRGSCT